MGNKSVQKKRYIVEKAREVFGKNGYRKVTMKDIVEACGISRGGLYLYFTDTKSLFEAVLETEEKDTDILEAIQDREATPGEKLLMYLEAQKQSMMKQDNLATATFEYLFEQQEADAKNVRSEAVTGLERLIADGVKQDWMECENPLLAAKHIVYALDGMLAASRTTGISEEEIDQEIEYILGIFGLTLE